MSERIVIDPDGTPMREVWRLRKLGDEVRPAGWFLANERNWRVHPFAQQQALKGALDDLGWIGAVKVNMRTSPEWGAQRNIPTLWDGHARITEALKVGEDVAVPLEYYDLSPAEEAEALLTYDPLAAMAGTDPAALDALLREVSTDSPALAAMLDDLAQEAGIVPGGPPVDPEDLWRGMPDFEQEDKAWKMLRVYFTCEDDYLAFQRLIGQALTDKTTFVWYPEQPAEDLTAYRVEDES